jgi:hypothetical protein
MLCLAELGFFVGAKSLTPNKTMMDVMQDAS